MTSRIIFTAVSTPYLIINGFYSKMSVYSPFIAILSKLLKFKHFPGLRLVSEEMLGEVLYQL